MKHLLLALAAITLAACGGDAVRQPIEKKTWELVQINGEPVGATARPATMEFDAEEKRVGGNGGCNRYNASYELEAQEISFGPAMSTMMACADGMDVEAKFLNILPTIKTFALIGDELILYCDNHRERLRFAGSAHRVSNE